MRSGGQVDLESASGSDGTLVDGGRRGHVLERHAGAVEDDDLVVIEAPRPEAGDHLSKLGAHVSRGHHPGCDGVVQVADRRGLFEDVYHDGAGGHERRLDLLLVFIVGADRRDKGPRGD